MDYFERRENINLHYLSLECTAFINAETQECFALVPTGMEQTIKELLQNTDDMQEIVYDRSNEIIKTILSGVNPPGTNELVCRIIRAAANVKEKMIQEQEQEQEKVLGLPEALKRVVGDNNNWNHSLEPFLNKLNAIKRLMEEIPGLRLREAKEAIENYAAKNNIHFS